MAGAAAYDYVSGADAQQRQVNAYRAQGYPDDAISKMVPGYRPQSSAPSYDGQQYSSTQGYGMQGQQAYGGGGVTPGGVGGGVPIPSGGYMSGAGLDTTVSAAGGQQSGGGLSQSAYEQQQQEQLQAQLSRGEFDYRLRMLKGLGKGTPGAIIQHDASGNEQLARANAFAQAKEKAGLNAAAALKSLQATMAGSGRAGSSQEMDRAYDILGTGRSDVNTFINKQLESDLQRAAQVSDLVYQGGITQRGQDMSQVNPILGLMTAGRLY